MRLQSTLTAKTVLGLSATTAFMLAATAQAQDWDKYYLDVKVGPAFIQSTAIKTSQFGNSGSIHFDGGVRADIDFGYNLCRDFAVEFETGVSRNTIDTMAGNTLSDFDSDADLYQIPVLINGIYKIPLHGSFKPYIGVGVGGVSALFHQTNVPGTTGRDFNDQDFVFAYQAMLGFKWALGERFDFGLAYEFMGTTDHEWSDLDVNLKTSGTMTHSVVATLTWHF